MRTHRHRTMRPAPQTLLMLPIPGLKPYSRHMGAASDIAEVALALAALENGLVGNVEFSDGGSGRDECAGLPGLPRDVFG
jgi:hypothetical protein